MDNQDHEKSSFDNNDYSVDFADHVDTNLD